MRFLADENFDNGILRGLHRVIQDFDTVRVQDTEMFQAPDPEVLEWAAKEGRILLTHDRETMINFAYERISIGLSTPGVIEVAKDLPIGQAIEHLAIMISASTADEFEDRVRYIPIT